MIRILIRKHLDLIKIFVGLCLEPIHNSTFRIISKFITDPVQDPDKNGRKDFTNKLARVYSGSVKDLCIYRSE